ncbi:MAG: hypothetical protein BWY71_02012 [Planctomycetes bacterium ADurb.Bin412]|nr:MAG: hypothetical protein BWY71_02012 [Planctomycetes bacterium ADurb.Bin412]
MEGIDRLDIAAGGIDETIFQACHRQRTVVGIQGDKGTPAGNFHLYRQRLIFERNGRKRKAALENGLGKAGQAPTGSAQTKSRAATSEDLPGGDRPFQYPRYVAAFSLDTQGGKQAGFIPQIRAVPQRNMRNGPRAFQAHHSCSHTSQREGNMRKVRTIIGGIVPSGGIFSVLTCCAHTTRKKTCQQEKN